MAPAIREGRETRYLLSEYDPSLFMSRHEHPDAYFTVVLSGGFEEKVGPEVRSPEIGRIVFHPAGEEHEVRFGNLRTRTLRIELAPSLLAYARGAGVNVRQPRLLEPMQTEWLGTRIAAEFTRTDTASILILEAMTWELLASMGRCERLGPGKERIRLAVERIRDCPSDEHSLRELAAHCSMHPTSFSRAFTREVGVPVGEYVRRVRVQHASRMLATGHRTVAEVAADAGFADQAHFARVFRKLTGQTPLEYRKTQAPG